MAFIFTSTRVYSIQDRVRNSTLCTQHRLDGVLRSLVHCVRHAANPSSDSEGNDEILLMRDDDVADCVSASRGQTDDQFQVFALGRRGGQTGVGGRTAGRKGQLLREKIRRLSQEGRRFDGKREARAVLARPV